MREKEKKIKGVIEQENFDFSAENYELTDYPMTIFEKKIIKENFFDNYNNEKNSKRFEELKNDKQILQKDFNCENWKDFENFVLNISEERLSDKFFYEILEILGILNNENNEEKVKDFHQEFCKSILCFIESKDEFLELMENVFLNKNSPINKAANYLEEFLQEKREDFNIWRENQGFWSLEKIILEFKQLAFGCDFYHENNKLSINKNKINRYEMLFQHSKFFK